MMRRVILALVALGVATAAPAADQVTSLPGWEGTLPSSQYSGYLSVNETSHFHYWFVASENDPANDPTVLWLNGGPGCSSLDGYLYEHGPFRVDENDYSKLVRNEYTWATKANMLYLESPVGVGFSYSDDPADYVTDDDKTAAGNLMAVEKFFEVFPELKANKFFITGESYAGIYVPTLAEAILKAGDAYTGAPLSGIAVGNGCSGSEIGICGWGSQGTYYETKFLMGKAFISEDLKDEVNEACDWSVAIDNSGDLSAACDAKIAEAHAQIGNINVYNVYGDCIDGMERVNKAGLHRRSALGASESGGLGGPNACIDSRAGTAWINQPEVIDAIHVNAYQTWGICSNSIEYTSTRPNLPRDTYPFLNENIRVIIYNGDWDACVPYTDNEAWTASMGYSVTSPWHAWLYKNSTQVAGYATVYDTPKNFTFITIRGGRHEVPETAPEQALEMLGRLIEGTDF